ADLVFTADEEWMRFLAEKGVLEGEPAVVAGGTLVAAVSVAAEFAPGAPEALADPRVRHLAIAGEGVPAGKRAREALAAAGVLERLRPRIVETDNVRAALAWVARGEAQAGVAYASDARSEPRVRVAFAFDPKTHGPVRYPAAV